MVPAAPGPPIDKPSWRDGPDSSLGRAIPTLLGLRKHLVDKGLLGEKQHQTVRVAMRTLGHVVLAPIALIMIVLGGVVFSLVLIYAKLKQL